MSDSPIVRLPLHGRHAAAGARFSPFAGFEMPMRYETGILDEHAATRKRCGLFDVSHMGEVVVRGPDAIRAVDHIVTNDARALFDGRAMYTVMCYPDGGIVDDLIVYRLSQEEVFICVNASNRAKDFDWIRENLRGNCEARDESAEWAQLALQGPRALEIAAPLVDIDASSIRYYHAARGNLAGAPVLISRTGYTGEDGFEFYIPVGEAERVFDALVAAGKPYGLALVGLGARDVLRLEARLPLYGNDIDETTNPIEAGLQWVVKLGKEDFIGRDALVRTRDSGPTRRLRGLVLRDKGVMRHGYPIHAGGARVGTVTSGGVAPSLDGISVALGYIDAAHCNDEVVDVEIRDRKVSATVTKDPFYKRPN